MKTLIAGGRIVNEGRTYDGSLVIEDDTIIDIVEGTQHPEAPFDQTVDASGCLVLPGVIDDHVHFREPGLTDKADISTESLAAAAGGVTSYFEMPNTVPQTTTLQTLDEKRRLAAQKSHVNYAFFFGATNDNAALFSQLVPVRVPGIKLFMGSSTGNMLVDRDEALSRVFETAARLGLPLMAHCEDTGIISRNMAEARQRYGDDPPVSLHPLIRSEEACLASTRKAVGLALRYGTRLHVAHVTTAAELELFTPHLSSLTSHFSPLTSHRPLITAEATVGHLWFSSEDYDRLGSRIKVNPAVKSRDDRDALRRGLTDGRIFCIGTDHAPHLLSQKAGGCARAASGMPTLQFSLVAMLQLVDEGVLSAERLVELMCHQPARLFGVEQRGYLRPGYKADVAIVRRGRPWTVTPAELLSKCGWSPFEGQSFSWRVEQTFCNGHLVYNKGVSDASYTGRELRFNHTAQ